MQIHNPPRIAAEIPEFRIKYKDIFHLRNLYNMMHELFWEEGWNGKDDDRWHSDIETMYSELMFQKGIHGGGKEMWVWWRLKKDAERGNNYFKWTLDVDFHVSYMKEIEVIHQGKKLKVNMGEVELFFRPKMESDINGDWRNHYLLKHFLDFYEERLLHQQIHKLEKMLWRDVYKIHSKIKDFLNLRVFVPTAPVFHPKLYAHESEF